MINLVFHYLFGVLAVAAGLTFVGVGAALPQFLDSDRSIDDKLTTSLTPSRRESDFIGPGWRLQQLQWVRAPLCILFTALFLVTGG